MTTADDGADVSLEADNDLAVAEASSEAVPVAAPPAGTLEPPTEPTYEEPGAQALVDVVGSHVVWRVYGISQQYTDRPDHAWTATTPVPGHNSDEIVLHLGDIPDEVVQARRDAAAHGVLALTMLSRELDGRTNSEVEAFLQGHADAADEIEKDLRGGFPLHLILEYRRATPMTVSAAGRFQWLRSEPPTPEQLETFGQEASFALDLVTARLIPILGQRLRLDRATYASTTTHVTAPGKAAVALPNLTMSATASTSSLGWPAAPFDEIEAGLAAAAAMSGARRKLVATPARWLVAAMREDKDTLRRFLFAFFGLEVLANKVGKDVEKATADALSARLEGLPLDVLFWPKADDNDSPHRNLVFRFALVAVALSPGSATDDIAAFKSISKQRNDLAHGTSSDDAIRQLPAWPAIELLQKYVGLTATRDGVD